MYKLNWGTVARYVRKCRRTVEVKDYDRNKSI